MPLSVTSVIGNFHFSSPLVASSARTAPDAGHRRRARHGNEGPVDAAAEVPPLLIFDGSAAEYRRVAFPRRDVEETSARTVGRRIPVRPALVPRPGRLPRRLRRLIRPPALVEAIHPVHFHEGLADEKLPRLALEHVEVAVAVCPDH